MSKCPYPSPQSSFQYVLFNNTTGNVFMLSNNLKIITQMYHKIPRRKHSTILLMSNYTGEIIRSK